MSNKFRRYLIFSLIISLSVSLPFFVFVKKKRLETLSYQTQTGTVPNISAQVGEYEISKLTGFGSPYTEVELRGQGTARKTTADETGYFEFSLVPLKKTYGELCLTSIDVSRKITLPVCLPKLPVNQTIIVKGVLLPPSLSIESDEKIKSETAKASGMTFPDSEVDVYLFNEKQPSFWQKILSSILSKFKYFSGRSLAVGLPKYVIKSNQNGYFEFSLPVLGDSVNRFYTTAIFSSSELPNSSPSPISNTLSYSTRQSFNFLFLLLLLPIFLLLLLVRKKDRSLVPYKPYCQTDIISGNKVMGVIRY